MTTTLLRGALLASLLLSPPALADTIHLTNGKSIDDATIQEETFREVTYKSGGKRDSVATDQVLRIDYRRKPQLVDRAETALAEGHFLDAIDDFDLYVSGFLEGGKKERLAWAPAYAANRLVETQFSIGAWDEVATAADRLIASFPESRFVPGAFLMKAEALDQSDKGAAAQTTLKALSALIEKESLSARWRLECDLALVLTDDETFKKEEQRRERLVAISAEAGTDFPTVRNRADVAEGTSWLEDKNYKEAEEIFRRIVDDPKADDRTLAGAYTGLGDCIYQRATKTLSDNKDAQPLLKEALLAYLRVVVSFKDQTVYVPKAMFYSGRIFDLTGTEQSKERAQRMYREVLRQYPGTPWAEEAGNFKR